jgi:hypothetical protein
MRDKGTKESLAFSLANSIKWLPREEGQKKNIGGSSGGGLSIYSQCQALAFHRVPLLLERLLAAEQKVTFTSRNFS